MSSEKQWFQSWENLTLNALIDYVYKPGVELEDKEGIFHPGVSNNLNEQMSRANGYGEIDTREPKKILYKGTTLEENPKRDSCPDQNYRPNVDVMKCESRPRRNLKELYDAVKAKAEKQNKMKDFLSEKYDKLRKTEKFFDLLVDERFKKRMMAGNYGGRKKSRKRRRRRRTKKRGRKLRKKSRKRRRR